MIQENIYSAKTRLSRLIEKALEGEEVVIAKAGKPVVRLVPYTEKVKPVRYGSLKGKITIPDDFDDYTEEVAEMFSEYTPEDG
jgi:prevent-host-death family protein